MPPFCVCPCACNVLCMREVGDFFEQSPKFHGRRTQLLDVEDVFGFSLLFAAVVVCSHFFFSCFFQFNCPTALSTLLFFFLWVFRIIKGAVILPFSRFFFFFTICFYNNQQQQLAIAIAIDSLTFSTVV